MEIRNHVGDELRHRRSERGKGIPGGVGGGERQYVTFYVSTPNIYTSLDEVTRTTASRAAGEGLLAIRVALTERQKLRIRYVKEDGEATERVIRPLGAFFWGRSWTVTAWCELRDDFRNFRLDRIASIDKTGETFVDMPSRSLGEYLRSIGVGEE